MILNSDVRGGRPTDTTMADVRPPVARISDVLTGRPCPTYFVPMADVPVARRGSPTGRPPLEML